ncbi:hypothetical protein ABZ214_17615 [Streptomyces iakyrus]|uniref:hypothetical protein n=1 Tax=Streptomyces iakyrus TaxID=68219 RepID=UPI0033B0C516
MRIPHTPRDTATTPGPSGTCGNFTLTSRSQYLEGPYESPGIEIEDGRDDLEEVLRHLPTGARADLGRLVERIDTEFERRTLPNPGWVSEWTAGRWWWWRLRER